MSSDENKNDDIISSKASFIDVLLLTSDNYNRLMNSVAMLADSNKKLVKVVKNHQNHIMYLYDVISAMQRSAMDSTYDAMIETVRNCKNEKLN